MNEPHTTFTSTDKYENNNYKLTTKVTNENNNSNNLKSTDNSNYYIIEDQNQYNSNSDIQKIIDNAKKESTIEFKGSVYKNLYLNINKQLKILSKINTNIINSFNMPVFTISNKGSGTSISGFTVNLEGSFIDAKSASNIIVSNNIISTKETSINFNEVYNSKILNNNFLSFKTAVSIQKSGAITISKNNITPNNAYAIGIILKDITNKNGINILDNNISCSNGFSQIGINIENNVQYVSIKKNIISKWEIGINFVNSANNINIYNNTISKNYNGLIINGWLDNFSFTKNTVTNNYKEGILFDYEFLGSKNKPTIENNFFAKNQGLDMRSPGPHGVEIGKNFAKNLCSKIKMYTQFYIKTIKNGNKYIFSVTDHRNRNIGGDLPNFSATMELNGITYTVLFSNGIGYLETNCDSTGLGSAKLNVGNYKNSLDEWGSFNTISSEEFNKYIQEYFGYSDNNNKQNSESNQNATSNSGSGSGSSGSSSSNGNSYVSSNTGSSSSFSGSSSSASESSSSSESPSNGASSQSSQSSSSSSIVKELSADDENFKVAGITGLLAIIMIGIGMYYREDIFEMVGNN